MNKKILLILLTFVSAIALTGCNGKYISKSEVKDIIRKTIADYSTGRDIKFYEIDLDREDGTYDVEFSVDGIKYDYEINATNGNIVYSD